MIIIEDAKKEMLPEILAIMNYYIAHTTANLRTTERTDIEMQQWYKEHEGVYPIIVATEDAQVIGYASLSQFRPSEGYNQTAELSIYVHPAHLHKGIGALLMQHILEKAKAYQIYLVVSVITAGNEGSVLFHQQYGFEQNGRLPEAGYKNATYHDVVFMTRRIN